MRISTMNNEDVKNEYIYPLQVFGKTLLFKDLKNMNELILCMYHPIFSTQFNIKTFDEAVGVIRSMDIPFEIESNQEKTVAEYADEYIAHIKSIDHFKHLTNNDHDLIIWGFVAGFKKCIQMMAQ